MTSFRVLGFLIAALLQPVLPAQITVISGKLAFQNSNSGQSKRPLSNADVLGEKTILLAIQQGPTQFDTSSEALIRLKKADVSDALLNAMLLASNADPQAHYLSENQEGCQLFRKALDAMGGPKLTSVGAIRFKATGIIHTGVSEKISVQLEEVSVYPDKTYRQMQLPTGLITEVITPQTNYLSSGNTISAVPRADLLQERVAWKSSPIYIAQHLENYTCAPQGTEQIGNVPSARLRISGEGIEFYWNIDPSVSRILRVRAQASNGEMVNDLSDWRLIDGIYIPFRSHRVVNGLTIDRTITEYQVNPTIDAKLFEPPGQISRDSQPVSLGRSTVASAVSNSQRDTNPAAGSLPGAALPTTEKPTIDPSVSAASGAGDWQAPAAIKVEHEKGLPVTYYTPKNVPTKTPGSVLGSVFGATSWKIYPIAAHILARGHEAKMVGLRIDFGTGSENTSIYPEAVWFFANDELVLQRPVPYGEVTRRGIYNSYRIEWTGPEIDVLLRTLAVADKASMTVFDQSLSGGRFTLTFKKKELAHFGPFLEFYRTMPGQEVAEAK
jgi:hypothetical protein